MKAALIQSCYVPWKGYFDIIHDVDLFIFHDDLQYTKADWRNRNRIKTPGGPRWLSIPVGSSEHRRICDVAIPEGAWALDHWRRLCASYASAPYFARYRELFEYLYLGARWRTLSELNQAFTRIIAHDVLGIRTRFADSSACGARRTKSERILEILEHYRADAYLSGPSARSYLDEARFASQGVTVTWKDYAGYPRYTQRFPPFEHRVTILDLVFQTGPDAPYFIWGWREDCRESWPAAAPLARAG